MKGLVVGAPLVGTQRGSAPTSEHETAGDASRRVKYNVGVALDPMKDVLREDWECAVSPSSSSVVFFCSRRPHWRSSVKTQDVTFPSGPDTIAGYLAAPDSPGQHPALVVIHEDWGLTDWVKAQTRRLAERGYVALAVDLYRGQVAHDPAFAYELMVGTPAARAIGRHGGRHPLSDCACRT